MGLFSRFLFRARFLSAIVSKQLVATRHTAPSPPLRGRAGEGGSHGRGRSLWLPPSLTLPRKGEGNRGSFDASPPHALQHLLDMGDRRLRLDAVAEIEDQPALSEV